MPLDKELIVFHNTWVKSYEIVPHSGLFWLMHRSFNDPRKPFELRGGYRDRRKRKMSVLIPLSASAHMVNKNTDKRLLEEIKCGLVRAMAAGRLLRFRSWRQYVLVINGTVVIRRMTVFLSWASPVFSRFFNFIAIYAVFLHLYSHMHRHIDRVLYMFTIIDK